MTAEKDNMGALEKTSERVISMEILTITTEQALTDAQGATTLGDRYH